jgi:hypothetical protein
MNIDAIVERACERIPGLVCSGLVLLPEGYLLGSAGDGGLLDLEPVIRSAARCLSERATPAFDGRPAAPFVEYLFVIRDQLVVIEGGRRDPRLALILACTREPNIALALGLARLALAALETAIDLSAWTL